MLKQVDTIKALNFLGYEPEQSGTYVYFECHCGARAVIRAYGDKKNVWYCPECKSSGHIISLTMKIKRIEYNEAIEELKKFKSNSKITQSLNLTYETEYHEFLEQQGLVLDFCKQEGIGKPKGKTMLSGCIAIPICDEDGNKIAYIGVRIKDRKVTCHKSFNPELYLYGHNRIDPHKEVFFTTDMIDCLKGIQNGIQAVCNFGLPYVSQAQLELLNKCGMVTFYATKDIAHQLSQQFNSYMRIKRNG